MIRDTGDRAEKDDTVKGVLDVLNQLRKHGVSRSQYNLESPYSQRCRACWPHAHAIQEDPCPVVARPADSTEGTD